MEWHRTPTVRNHEFQQWKILEQFGREELHERSCVGVQIMRTRCVEGGIASRGHVDHSRHLKLPHFFVEWIPPAIGERWFFPVAARRIGIQIAADKSKVIDATL